VRETDLAVRLGGEEFVVLLPGARLKHAKTTAEKLRLAIEELEIRVAADVTIRLTASLGIAEFPTYATADALFSAADSALYQAKRSGKNRVATATVQRASSTARRPASAPAPSAS
jgi:diguanylate cyclase (GGDEF)-like protein